MTLAGFMPKSVNLNILGSHTQVSEPGPSWPSCLCFFVYFLLFFFASFTKGTFFMNSCLVIDLFGFWKRKLLKNGLLLKERICSEGSKFFPLRVGPHGGGGQK